MKLVYPPREQTDAEPAAFRRLCVETILFALFFLGKYPAAFRRLCVETSDLEI